MFYLIHINTIETLMKVAIYCIMDSIFMLEIFNVSLQWIKLIEVANTSIMKKLNPESVSMKYASSAKV